MLPTPDPNNPFNVEGPAAYIPSMQPPVQAAPAGAPAYGGNKDAATIANLPHPDVVPALVAGKHITPEQGAAIITAHGRNPGDYGLGSIQKQIGETARQTTDEESHYRQNLDESAQAQQLAAEKKASDQIDQAKQAAAYDAEHQKQMADYATQQAQETADMQTKYQERRNVVDRMVSDASTAHVDPEAARGSIGNRAIAGLAMALGAMGSAYTGGPNVAAQIVQKTIEDNLQSQKDEIENKWRGAGAARNALADAREQLGDHAAADHAFRAQEAQKYLDYMKGLDLQHAPQQIQAQAAQIQAQLEQTKNDAAHNATLHSLQSQSQNLGTQAQVAGERGNLDINRQRLSMEQQKANEKAGPKEPAEIIAKHEKITSLLDEMDKQGEGGTAYGTERAHKAGVTTEALKAALREHMKISERHPELVDAMVSDPTQWRSDKAKTQRDQLRTILENETNSQLKPYGYSLPGKADPGGKLHG
jgi:hypothetical protein